MIPIVVKLVFLFLFLLVIGITGAIIIISDYVFISKNQTVMKGLENGELIKEYFLRGNPLFKIKDIVVIRDGGTIAFSYYGPNGHPFYIHKDDFTLHNAYPTTDENRITDKPTQSYFLDRLEKYKVECEFNLEMSKNVIEKIKW